MFIDDEEKLSDLYQTPSDRKVASQESAPSSQVLIEDDNSIVLDMAKTPEKKIEPSVRDSKTEIPLSSEDIELKRKKKKLIMFILLMTLNLAFFGYIIYLVVTIFMNL